MKGIGEERNPNEQWYHTTDDGGLDPSRPMTDPEMVKAYWDSVDGHPEMLADLYVNFHQFDTVEFMIFKDRLSAAILVANSTAESVDALRIEIEDNGSNGSDWLLDGMVKSEAPADVLLRCCNDARHALHGYEAPRSTGLRWTCRS